MTDRELLELAAKAAGLEFDPTVQNQFGLLVVAEDASCQSDQKLWNPLTDDGDALRLAVKLKLIVTFADGGAGPHVCAGKRPGPFSNEKLPIKMFALDEERAATRRAIVRAAAEIGKEKNT